MVPVLGGKVEEGEQSFPVLRQTGDRLLVLGVVFAGEYVDRRLGRRAGINYMVKRYLLLVYSVLPYACFALFS